MLRTLRKLASLFARPTGKPPVGSGDSETEEASETGEVWCLVGNIVEAHPHGEEKGVKGGSKHFSAGTKVYCLPPQWGDGFERVVAVGLHRGSREWVTVVMPAEQITNWRAKSVHNRAALKRLRNGFRYERGDAFNRQWASRSEVESWVRELRQSEEGIEK